MRRGFDHPFLCLVAGPAASGSRNLCSCNSAYALLRQLSTGKQRVACVLLATGIVTSFQKLKKTCVVDVLLIVPTLPIYCMKIFRWNLKLNTPGTVYL
ncbi:hypothetical protein Y1Q_0001175 [Alligator mississippiensis]|uniref:Uncharacterized protein n=1 Tax=Alligator mississippiensis TaxID=8496 RepID=A0A151PF06_ALLMI|nr:hypothetical protein Y1Q_0001175 [Alligator mississippiensis]